jgi:hypothetical protein
MSTQQFIIYIVVIGVIYASYCSYRAKNKVYCTFTRRDKTTGHKWIKAKNGERIEFDGGWYYVVMGCITTEALDSGFNMIFPTMVRRLDFTWKSSYPKDPATGEPLPETPEMRKNLNKREDIEALNKGTQQAFGKGKIGLMGGGLLPIMLVIGLAASLYLIFQLMGKVDMLGQAINVLQQMAAK